jgi:hypothetical protein
MIANEVTRLDEEVEEIERGRREAKSFEESTTTIADFPLKGHFAVSYASPACRCVGNAEKISGGAGGFWVA